MQTLPRKVRATKEPGTKDGLGFATPAAEEPHDAEFDKPLGLCALLAHPAMRALVTSNAAFDFFCRGHEVVFVLYAYTPVPLGGLGFPVRPLSLRAR